MASYRDEGIVLRTMRLGEADRIVTIATPLHGRVRAVAKGVRKTKSHLGGRVEPLSHVKMLCWKGRELDIITGVEVLDHFRPLRESLDAIGPALTMLEIVDHVANEAQAMPRLFALLLGALRTLSASTTAAPGPPSPLLLGAFCWKLLVLEGLGPSTEQCASCADHRPLVAFDPRLGGFVCASCRRGQSVSREAVDLVHRILGGQLATVLSEPATGAGSEVERVGLAAVEYHLDRSLRAARQLR
jgi:DNA repair protein RecO (recombination protein O)